MIRFSISEKATFDGAAVDGAAEKADDVVRDAAVGFKAAIAALKLKAGLLLDEELILGGAERGKVDDG